MIHIQHNVYIQGLENIMEERGQKGCKNKRFRALAESLYRTRKLHPYNLKSMVAYTMTPVHIDGENLKRPPL